MGLSSQDRGVSRHPFSRLLDIYPPRACNGRRTAPNATVPPTYEHANRDARQSYAAFALATLQPSPWQPGGREERGGVRPPDPLPGTAQLNVNYADRGSFDARPLHDRILVKFFSSNDFHRQLKAIVNMSPLVKLFELLVQPVWFEFECETQAHREMQSTSVFDRSQCLCTQIQAFLWACRSQLETIERLVRYP